MTPELSELRPEELPAAAALVARGMRDNPLCIAAFGPDEVRRGRALERFFRPVLRIVSRKGRILVAREGGRLLGVCAGAAPGRCRPSLGDNLRILPPLLLGNSFRTVGRILEWTGEWMRLDPEAPHAHLGPVAVDRGLQGRGVGSALLSEYCRGFDAAGAEAYLETDREINVAFYAKAGFAVVAERRVIGVPNWFMARKPRK